LRTFKNMRLHIIPVRIKMILAGIIMKGRREMKQEEQMLRSVNIVLSRTNGLYKMWFQGRGLNEYLIRTLYALYMEPSLSQKEISDNYMIPSQTVNNSVKTLEKEGCLELTQDRSDRRRKEITFTDCGKKYAEEALSPIIELDRRVIRRMGLKKFQQLIETLTAYAEALRQEINEEDRNL